MSWYAAEQLAHQRRDQFATEARGGSLVRLARDVASPSEPSVGPSRFHRVAGLVNRLGGAMVARVSRPMRRPRGATESPIGSRGIGSRNV